MLGDSNTKYPPHSKIFPGADTVVVDVDVDVVLRHDDVFASLMMDRLTGQIVDGFSRLLIISERLIILLPRVDCESVC